MENQCPACSSVSTVEAQGGADEFRYDCPICGTFFMSRTSVTCLTAQLSNDSGKRPIAMHALRKMQAGQREPPHVTWDVMKRVLEVQTLPTVSEQVDNLVLWLGDHLSDIGSGEGVDITGTTHLAIVGAKTPEGVRLVVDHLYSEGVLIGPKADYMGEGSFDAHTTLTVPGWARYDALKRGAADSRKAFMAMPFGDDTLNRVLAECFRPAVAQTGFRLTRLDDGPKAGLIDDRLRVEIRTARFLLAELTRDNLGAYWEAGFAEGLGKPVIYTCERRFFEAKGSHFDTNHHLTVIWEDGQLADAAIQLKATIRATLPAEAKLTD